MLDSDDEEMGEGEEEEGDGGKAADLRTNMDVDDGEEAAEEGLRVSHTHKMLLFFPIWPRVDGSLTNVPG